MKIFQLLSIFLMANSVIFAEDAKNVVLSAQKDEAPSSFSLFLENDMGFSDRYYTSGVKFAYTSQGDDWWTNALQFAILRALGNFDNAQAWQSAAFGQMMYTGYDRGDPHPPADDRPYAGLLYLSSGAHFSTQNTLDSLTITLGLVGPQTYTGDIQRGYHDFIDVELPEGWDYQIKNEPLIAISYEHSKRIYKQNISDSFSTDCIASAGANLGNLLTDARLKALFRIGFNLPNSFSEKKIDYINSSDVFYYSNTYKNWHLYLYTGINVRFVGYDITLDGNTFAHSRSVDKKWIVGEGTLGFSARYKNFEASFSTTIRSEEFNTQKEGAHIYNSLALKMYF